LRSEISALNVKLAARGEQEGMSELSATSQLKRVKHENASLKQECAGLEAKNAELVVELLAVKSKLSDYTNSEIETESEAARNRAIIQSLRNDMNAIRAEKVRLEDAVLSLQRSQRASESSTMETSQKIERYQRVIESHKQNFASVAGHLQKRYIAFSNEIERRSKSFTRNFSAMDRRLQDLTQKIASRRNSDQKSCHVIATLAQLSAKLANMNASEIPSIDRLITDPSALTFFTGRVEHAAHLKDLNHKSELKKLEQAKPSPLSPEVAQLIRKMEGTMSEMTRTLHQDHKQLIQVLE
jgi:chromosome segregation ATPase